MLTTRVLPVDEWARLLAVEPYRTLGLPGGEADAWRVVVVERDGVIVGTCAVFTTVHWDCWWIDKAARGKAGVLRALLRAGLQLLAECGVGAAYTGAETGSPELAALLVEFGFVPAAGRLFVLDIDRAVEAVKEVSDGRTHERAQ